jgi:hypothetical protein
MKQRNGNPNLVGDFYTRFCGNLHVYIVTMNVCNYNRIAKRDSRLHSKGKTKMKGRAGEPQAVARPVS